MSSAPLQGTGLTLTRLPATFAETFRLQVAGIACESTSPLFARASFERSPSTLHPTPYTLHPKPCTLHPTPDALPPTPYTLSPTPCTFNPGP